MSSPAYELARCPVCGGAETRLLAGEEDVRAEVEALWEFHSQRLRPETPPEHLTDRVAFSQQPPLRVVQCTECDTVYRNPRERAHELAAIYGEEALEQQVLRTLLETQHAAYVGQATRLTEVAGRPGHGVEVGSYVGGFLAASRDAGWRFEGLDINEHVNDFARSNGFTVRHGDLTSYQPASRLDAVAIWNCFDQLAEPRQAAAAARRMLHDGGILAVRVPNGAFYAALRAGGDGGARRRVARALLAHNNLLTFPYRQAFTAGSLERLLADTGFAVERIYGDTLVPIADDWTRGWAALEEKAVKGALRLLARAEADAAPWLEVYARAT